MRFMIAIYLDAILIVIFVSAQTVCRIVWETSDLSSHTIEAVYVFFFLFEWLGRLSEVVAFALIFYLLFEAPLFSKYVCCCVRKKQVEEK